MVTVAATQEIVLVRRSLEEAFKWPQQCIRLHLEMLSQNHRAHNNAFRVKLVVGTAVVTIALTANHVLHTVMTVAVIAILAAEAHGDCQRIGDLLQDFFIRGDGRCRAHTQQTMEMLAMHSSGCDPVIVGRLYAVANVQ